MNPLTLVKRIQNINSREAALGISEEASWHAKYKDSAYVYVGGIPFDLTEGDLLAVFAQYGEIVDVNLVRDKGTGKSKGFAFVAYEDQRSTNLAVDNLNGAQILGRIIRVDHVSKYKKKEEEDEETEQRKREERGVCRAFQRGDCTRGAGCKFSHDEQRAANTGWGEKDKGPSWGHDKFDGPKKNERTPGTVPQSDKRDGRKMGGQTDADGYNMMSKGYDNRENNRSRKHDEGDFQPKSRGDYDMEYKRSSRHGGDDDFVVRREEKRSKRDGDNDEFVTKSRDHDKEEEKRSRRYNDHEPLPKSRDGERGQERRSIKHNDDEFQSKSSRELDKRGEKYGRHDYDDVGRKYKEVDNKREDTRSSRHNDKQLESKSQKDCKRSNDKWSRI